MNYKYNRNTDLSKSYRNIVIYESWKNGISQVELAHLFMVTTSSIGEIIHKIGRLEHQQKLDIFNSPVYDEYKNLTDSYQITLQMVIEDKIL